MQNRRDSSETGPRADGRACNRVSNQLVSSELRLRRVAQEGRGAGEWWALLSLSIGPHE